MEKYFQFIIFLLKQESIKQELYFAGGSALMLHIISTFSSLAAPTKTTLSVAQIGASMMMNAWEIVKFIIYVLIIMCQHWSVVN